MLKNYLKIAYRNIFKNKVYSLINITGLAIGMAACFFVFQYVYFEKSYDRFHRQANDIYRVAISYGGSFGSGIPTATNHPAVGPAMKAAFPEVKDFARLAPASLLINPGVALSRPTGQGHSRVFNEERVFFADPSLLTMFSFPMVAGRPETALSAPSSAVITESMARKYFGSGNAMHQTLLLNGQAPLKITGILKDVPENSHMKFDMLISFNTLSPEWGYGEWGWPEFYNYVALAPGTDPQQVAAKLPAFIRQHLGKRMQELDFQAFFQLQRITDIHLHSAYQKEMEANGNERTVYFLSVIGIFILVIAWINYINLSTAKSMERSREVGLRKVVGAHRWQLAGQFMLESLIINVVALLLAALIVLLCSGYFNHFIGKNISQVFYASPFWRSPKCWLLMLAVFAGGTLQTGAYPAFVLSGFRPVLALKGKTGNNRGSYSFRKVLVACQFVLSLLLIAGVITVYSQLSYMRNGDLGYNKDQVLVVKAPTIFDSTFMNRVQYLKEEWLRTPGVRSVAASAEVPGKAIADRNSIRRAGQDKTHNFLTYYLQVDNDFFPTYKMELAAGRNFLPQDTFSLPVHRKVKAIINEKIVQGLGFASNEAALNQDLLFTTWWGDLPAQVIGIAKNYHQRSLKEKYDPIFYFYNGSSPWRYLSINMQTKDLHKNLAAIEAVYKRIFPGNAFDSFFLDEYFNRQYAADQQLGKVFGLFTALAIFIACLGLLGLSTLAIRLRTKEIGIRKVLGASVAGILFLFSRDFIKLVGFASLVAIPLVYFIADQWLNNFAFRIRLNWLIFVAPPLILLAIALLTVGLQSLKAALANPVSSLRNE